MASPQPPPLPPSRRELRPLWDLVCAALTLLVVLIVLIGTVGTSKRLDGSDEEESAWERGHSVRENPVELGRRAGQGSPPSVRRVRRNPPRSATTPPVVWSERGQSLCSATNCGNASNKELKRRFRVESIKEEILRKLRMDSTSSNTTTAEGHRDLNSMHQFYQLYQRGNHPIPPQQTIDEDYSTPIALIVQSQTVPQGAPNTSNSCYFKFLSPTYQPNQIVTAQLGVFLHNRYGPLRLRNDSVQLQVRRNLRRQPQQTNYRSKMVNANNPSQFGKWHFFDVKTLVQAWINHPERNSGITVTATDASLQALLIVLPRTPDEETLRPFIEMKIRPSSEVRVTRSTGPDCTEAGQESRCCRYPLRIDFDAFRWDWIIAPKRYDAFYCAGDCPFLYHQLNTITHVLQQIAPRGVSGPCCSPTHFSDLAIIYIDERSKNIVHSTIPGMIVDKCGCS